jgi:hypothetical protein
LMAGNPRVPSVVFRVCKPKPAGRIHLDLIGAMNSRTDSPSVHPCPASNGALGFFPASALLLHEALRPPGAEDARCVQPTSATHTTCVHPHLVRSRLSSHDFRRVDTPRSLRLRAVVPGDRTVHAVQTASADSPSHYTDAVRVPVFASCVLPHGFPDTSVGVFFPRREDQSSL